MKKNPTVSIIIPVYNVEKYLRRCLDSIAAQTFTDWEAICVNDGSPDDCDKILAEYAKRDKRFRVLNKKNGGLSDARNFGFPYARGEYILFVDSDDFIHPQTLELAVSGARRDGSDIVSFTYDRHYYPVLMVRHKLGLPTDNIMPRRYRKKYDMNKIATRVTDDIFQYATERTHNAFNPNRRWLIKHCQVWRNLYRRDLIADIPFIKGLLFEDFPWWSAVMLKNPRTTIMPLPLYFYIPNFGGICQSAKQLRIMQGLCAGIVNAYTNYRQNANEYQMKQWSENFMWYFVYWAFRKIKYMASDTEITAARRALRDLHDCGVFDIVPENWVNMVNDIYKFMGTKR